MSKALLIYFSRNNTTEKVMEKLGTTLSSKGYEEVDIVRLTDDVNWKGFLGFFRGGYYSSKKLETNINEVTQDPCDYDTLIVSSPVWSDITPAVRTYLNHLTDKPVTTAYIITCLGSTGHSIDTMKSLLGAPKAGLVLKAKDIKKDLDEKLVDFVDSL